MMQSSTLLLGRLGLSLVFILAGIGKIMAYPATAKILIAEGVAPDLLPLVIAIEVGGGLAILCGLATRSVALGLCAYSILTAILFRGHFADHAQTLNFLQSLAIAGGFLILAVHGPGDLSLDAWRRRRRQRQKIFF